MLPRLKGGITALSWVNGVAHKLVCASAGGHIFIADVIKPEDSSQKPYEFPQVCACVRVCVYVCVCVRDGVCASMLWPRNHLRMPCM